MRNGGRVNKKLVSTLTLVLLITLAIRILLVKTLNPPRGKCASTRYGSFFSGIYLPDKDILKQMLPRNSVIYIMGRRNDVAFEDELSRLTGTVFHTFCLKDEESIDKSSNTGKCLKIHKPNADSSTGKRNYVSESYLSDSMQQLGHSSIDVLKINNNNDVGMDIMKELFEVEIFPRIIILPSQMILRKLDGNTKSVNYKLLTFGYKTLAGSMREKFVTFVLSGCDVLLQRAKQISLQSGFVNLQVFNRGFLNMTKSWICNVRSMKDVLPVTLFVASDLLSYNELLNFENVNVVHENFTSPANMQYGETTYYSFTHFRTELILRLLENNINVWSTESDAVWLESPFDEMNPVMDMYIVNNQPNNPEVSVGMIYLKSTEDVIQLWKKLLIWRKNNPGQQEQAYLTELVKDTNALAQWLPSLEYISGLWYSHKEYRTGNEKIIQNNWIVGNKAKVERAKLYGHWFLQDNGTCKQNQKHVKALDFKV